MLIDKTPDPIKEKSKTEIQVKKDQKQEFKLIGSMVLKPGLTLYELDTQKMEIKECEIQRNNIVNFETKKFYQETKTKKIDFFEFGKSESIYYMEKSNKEFNTVKELLNEIGLDL